MRNLSTDFCLNTDFTFSANLFTIQLGSNYLSAEDPNRLELATSSYVLHPDFNPNTLENDIGLIQLRIPIEFTGRK